MVARRGTTNSNSRGNWLQRRRRKLWLLAEFGDGITVTCSFGCGAVLFYSDIFVDRYPVPGIEGGKYIKGNIRPSCRTCNCRDGAALSYRRKRDSAHQSREYGSSSFKL